MDLIIKNADFSANAFAVNDGWVSAFILGIAFSYRSDTRIAISDPLPIGTKAKVADIADGLSVGLWETSYNGEWVDDGSEVTQQFEGGGFAVRLISKADLVASGVTLEEIARKILIYKG
jgi:hypothetical protein